MRRLGMAVQTRKGVVKTPQPEECSHTFRRTHFITCFGTQGSSSNVFLISLAFNSSDMYIPVLLLDGFNLSTQRSI